MNGISGYSVYSGLIYVNPKKINLINAQYRQERKEWVYREESTIKIRKHWWSSIEEKIIPAGFFYSKFADDICNVTYQEMMGFDISNDDKCQIENQKIYQKAHIIVNMDGYNHYKYYDSDEEMKKDLASLLTSISEAGGHPFVKIS